VIFLILNEWQHIVYVKKKDEEGVLWISCDTCKGWYHPKCVGLNNEEVDEDEEKTWNCPLCTENDSTLSHLLGRQCGRTKCRNFVEGDELLCIDCKLVHIEKNSNKIKRMRMDDAKSNKQMIKITNAKVRNYSSMTKEAQNSSMKKVKVIDSPKIKVSNDQKSEKIKSAMKYPSAISKTSVDRLHKNPPPKFTIKTHMTQASIAKPMIALDMDDLLLDNSHLKKNSPLLNNHTLSPKITETPKKNSK